jgi:hypothetical protein
MVWRRYGPVLFAGAFRSVHTLVGSEFVYLSVRLASTGARSRGLYSVDWRIEIPAEDPILINGLQSGDNLKDATIGLHPSERWGVPHRGVGVFENEEDINRKSLARFSDVCDKQFSNLATNKKRLSKYHLVAGVIH